MALRMRSARLVPAVLGLAAAFSASLALCALCPGPAAADEASLAGGRDVKVDIPFTRTTLSNGLVVILHEDHALPLVAVNTMVHVGSHFEEASRTGFAHLFEHLMFMGTARAPTKMFDDWMEAEGGSNNAWTSEDRTDYEDVGPASTLPLLLWLEADRFSSLGKEMTQAKLDAQREVVRNERRQTSENRPYGKVELRLPELLYPPGHPYHHPVIGSHEDLQAATVDDVKAFFSHFYAPNDASLVVAGDFDPARVKPEIERLFGWIPRAEVPAEPTAAAPVLKGVVRETLVDEVKLPKIVMAWHSPKRFAPGDADLDLLGEILRSGKASRLYKALVYDHPLAQEVQAEQRSQDLSSIFIVEAIAQPGVSLDDLEKAIDAQLAAVTSAPPTPEELRRAQNQYETGFVARLQSVQARAALLNQYQQSVGDPGYAEKDLARYRAATPASIQAIARQVLDPNARVILRVVPREAPPAAAKPVAKAAAEKGSK
jgi:zinc protease